ncbi:MAG: VWA domain-containing protein, partial [Acidobacteriota bacterium]
MKRITAYLTTTLFLCCFSASTAQEDNEPPLERNETSRFQVETGLVEVRAVVTDKDGHVVEGLQREDFVLLENNEPQEISHFSVSKIEKNFDRIAAERKAPQDEDARLRQAQERLNRPPVRTILLYVDTLHLSFETLNDVKRALYRFIDEQLTDQDLVAFTTSATLGVAQQFTRDRKILRYAVEQMRYSPSNRDTLFTPFLAAEFIRDAPEGVRFGIEIMR